MKLRDTAVAKIERVRDVSIRYRAAGHTRDLRDLTMSAGMYKIQKHAEVKQRGSMTSAREGDADPLEISGELSLESHPCCLNRRRLWIGPLRFVGRFVLLLFALLGEAQLLEFGSITRADYLPCYCYTTECRETRC